MVLKKNRSEILEIRMDQMVQIKPWGGKTIF